MHTQAAFQCGLQFRTNYRVDVQRNQKIVVVAFCYGGGKKAKTARRKLLCPESVTKTYSAGFYVTPL